MGKFNLVLMAVLIAFSFSCKNNTKANTDEAASKSEEISIMQDKNALIEGYAKAVCYSGYRSGQHPDRGEGAKNPSNEEILEDLKIMIDEGFHLIRLYDSQENSETVIKLIAEHNIDMKVMLGIWLKAELSAHETCAWLTEPIPQEELDKNMISNQEEIQRGIALAKQFPEVIKAVNVGNEALVDWNDHKVHPDSIVNYVKFVKSNIEQPVTVAENYEWWAAHGEKLAAACDFISIHIYPVWEGRDIEDGIAYSLENIEKVKKALPNSKIVISEAGWASVAIEFGERASEEKQKQYYDWLMNLAEENNMTTFFFEMFDEDWKGHLDNALGAEKHWGIYNVDRTPKLVMQK